MPRRSLSVGLVLALGVYLTGAIAIVVGLAHVREATIENLSAPLEQTHWQKWKGEASRQDGTTGPVARRPPKSDEPPMLVLLRDHYAVIVVAGLTFYSFLFWLALFLGHGLTRRV